MEVCPDGPVHPSSGQEGYYNTLVNVGSYYICYDLIVCPMLWLDIPLVVWVSEPSAVRTAEVPGSQRMY